MRHIFGCMRVSKRELVAVAADPRPKPRSSSARALRVSTGTCEPARRQDSTPYISSGQILEIASQLPRTWCLLSPACYLMYEGARGHGGIQTPIYPPSRIARVSGRPVVPLLRGGWRRGGQSRLLLARQSNTKASR